MEPTVAEPVVSVDAVDVDSIEPGQNFVEAIQQAVGACEVMLVLIGRHWLVATDQDGRRRLDNAGDLVRLEVRAALDRGIRVIPVLVDGHRYRAVTSCPSHWRRWPIETLWS